MPKDIPNHTIKLFDKKGNSTCYGFDIDQMTDKQRLFILKELRDSEGAELVIYKRVKNIMAQHPNKDAENE